MNILIKVYSADCPVCAQLAEVDGKVAEEKELAFNWITLEELASFPEEDPLKSYVIHTYVNPNDGMVDIPIYVIISDRAIQASGVVQSETELVNLISSWEAFNSSRSSVTETD